MKHNTQEEKRICEKKESRIVVFGKVAVSILVYLKPIVIFTFCKGIYKDLNARLFIMQSLSLIMS